MKVIKKILLSFLLIFVISSASLALVSCNGETEDNPDGQEEVKEWYDQIVFEDKTFEYDGNSHSIYVENLPEGATVNYNGNNAFNAGNYTVTASITFNDEVVKKTAKIIITKAESTITAELNQVIYLSDSTDNGLVYSLNNSEQKAQIILKSGDQTVSTNKLKRVGQYKAEIYAKESKNYKESNHLTINVTVKNSKFDISYDDLTITADGAEHELALVGELPEGYMVVYENNIGKVAGNYYAKASIKEISTGVVVEEHRATLTIDNPDNEDFEKYLDDFFVMYLEGDQLSVNIFCEVPSDFGLERYEANWYTYSHITIEDILETREMFNELLEELTSYKDCALSNRQLIAYNQIEEFLNYQIRYYNLSDDVSFMELTYVDQFGGYVADFGTYMEAYTLREKADVDDVVNFITSTKEAFASYLDFVNDKTLAGYALSDFTLNAMIDYLDDILESHNPDSNQYYYLQEVLFTKIEGLTFLSDLEKSAYKKQIADAINDSFIEGVKILKEGLEENLGNLATEDEGYWASYEKGSDFFELELDYLLGLDDFDMEKYIKELDTAINSTFPMAEGQLNNLIYKYNISTMSALNRLLRRNSIFSGTPEEMLEYLKEFAKTIVPSLDYSPNITIKEMDAASAKVSNAVAYYMKSALDNFNLEYITLNPTKLGDSNDVLGTLAHEGYPGHLYAYCFSKQLDIHNLSKIMSSTAHAEGWATYVELKLYEYALENTSQGELYDVIQYLYYNHLSGFLLETRLDVGIHYQGWTVDKVGQYLKSNGYDSSAAGEIYNLLIEMPVGYAAYGYGKLYFYNLHQEAKSILGDYYDEIEFNTMLLSKGWTSLGELHKTYNEYMTKTCHRYGIEY